MNDPEAQSSSDVKTEITFQCAVDAPDLEAFVACLALGVLEAMQSAIWTSDAGTWTLARPVFWQALEKSEIHRDLLDVLQGVDELSALEKLRGRAAVEAEIDRMIAVVHARLVARKSSGWRATWHAPQEDRKSSSTPTAQNHDQ